MLAILLILQFIISLKALALLDIFY